MDLMEAIKGRRSIRKYRPDPVAEEDFRTLLEAVRWAPSWANTQCWELILVKDPEIKHKLQQTMHSGNPAAKSIVEAPMVIALCAKLGISGYKDGKVRTKFGDWFMFDLGIITEIICLAALGLNLGTVIVGTFEHDKAKEILKIPEGYELVVLIPLGYPAQEGRAPSRREPREFLRENNVF